MIFTIFYEFMLQKVLKFANYAAAVLVAKLCYFAPIMPKLMLAQSAKAYLHTKKARHRDTSRRDLASRCVF